MAKRKRSSQTNKVVGKNILQSRSHIGQSNLNENGTGVNYFRLFLIVVILVSSFILLWKKPGFESEASSSKKQNEALHQGQTKPLRKQNGVKLENQEAKKKPINEFSGSDYYKNFKSHILNRLQVKKTNVVGATIKIKQLQHHHKDTTVRAYVLENFLSIYECDALAAAHDSHVAQTSKLNPLLCFDSIKTFRQNLREVSLKIQVSNQDFLQGTTCINESLSQLVSNHGMKWSYSTSFYPGESKFSLKLQERIKQATGLSPENGGKFQITSYPKHVGYKNHTDCIVGGADKRDRYATILVYLKDVAKGGETAFPQLGLSVTPRKGLALVWNSMSEDGKCDPTSIHNAAEVIKGQKYILQRWYYYQNFPSLGKRMTEPALPERKANQPRVSCDEYEFGSCRWYDEWNYDHITEYVRNQDKYM